VLGRRKAPALQVRAGTPGFRKPAVIPALFSLTLGLFSRGFTGFVTLDMHSPAHSGHRSYSSFSGSGFTSCGLGTRLGDLVEGAERGRPRDRISAAGPSFIPSARVSA